MHRIGSYVTIRDSRFRILNEEYLDGIRRLTIQRDGDNIAFRAFEPLLDRILPVDLVRPGDHITTMATDKEVLNVNFEPKYETLFNSEKRPYYELTLRQHGLIRVVRFPVDSCVLLANSPDLRKEH